MKKGRTTKTVVGAFVSSLVLALALAGCSTAANTSTADDSPAAQNRQYMSQLNQKMDSLQSDMNDFQDAVGKKDVVTMRAKASDASKIVQDVNNTDAPDALSDVKGEYADALDQLDQALGSYTDLYTQLQNGQVDQASFDAQVQQVQESYDQGVDKLKQADQDVEDISKQ